MNKLKQKIAALLTVGISILPSASFNNVKANEILYAEEFFGNFQEKGIPVYKTNDNLLVDAKLNYINGEGKLLGKDDEKVSVSDELKDKIKLHPVFEYINDFEDVWEFSKSQFADKSSHIFVKTRAGRLKVLYFNFKTGHVSITNTIKTLVDSSVIGEFGEAIPALKDIDDDAKSNLVLKLQQEGNSIKNKNNKKKVVNPSKSGEGKDSYDSYVAAGVTGLVGVGLAGYILSNLSAGDVVNLD